MKSIRPMKSIVTLIAVAFTALVSNVLHAEGGSYQSAPPSQKSPSSQSGGAMGAQGQPPSQGKQVAPDNTGRNEERQAGKPEADDQSNQSGDLELTARLRRAITEDDSLSVNAHNIKIISSGGKVTLRGPVDSEQEKRRIEALAGQVAGQQRVTSELEVRKQ
ncbi:MAG: hypothetical protein K0S46_1820 [Moraxellaceae bacterium]|jgi:hypothetical protein|nr:hypothetical protein [Moraxellaceae bacterium]